MADRPVFLDAAVYDNHADAEADYLGVADLHAAGMVGTCDAAVIEKGDGRKEMDPRRPTPARAAVGGQTGRLAPAPLADEGRQLVPFALSPRLVLRTLGGVAPRTALLARTVVAGRNALHVLLPSRLSSAAGRLLLLIRRIAHLTCSSLPPDFLATGGCGERNTRRWKRHFETTPR